MSSSFERGHKIVVSGDGCSEAAARCWLGGGRRHIVSGFGWRRFPGVLEELSQSAADVLLLLFARRLAMF